MRRFAGFACIDWSGAKGERLHGIAVAECERGRTAPVLVAPAGGGRWSRQAVLDWLVQKSRKDILVGVDFSAALPFADRGAYFPDMAGSPPDARALWQAIDVAGGDHLSAEGYLGQSAVMEHFRIGAATGRRFERGLRNGRLRRVETEVASGRAASCFNLVGANQVGKSSLTGMRVLHRLSDRVRIWPFDRMPATGALIVEIYTSIAAASALTRPGRSKIVIGEDLDRALTSDAIDSEPFGHKGSIDDHRSDAILTAAWLRRAADEDGLWRRPPPPIRNTEGWTFGVPYPKEGLKPA